MKSIKLLNCPVCKGDFDYRNMREGVCPECQLKIEEGDEGTLNSYFAIPLEELQANLVIREKWRLRVK